MSTIWQAAESGDCARLRALIESGANVDEGDETTLRGWTPLMFAALRGHADAVELLLEHNADVELKSEEGDHWLAGSTALHCAVKVRCDKQCIELLLGAGANIDATNEYGCTPLLELLLYSGLSKQTKKKIAALLINSGARVTDRPLRVCEHIISAVRENNREVAKMLLRAGAVIPWDSRLIYDNPANALVKRVKARGGWKSHAAKHKRVLVGLVTKCKPIPDDAAGLVVEFYCPVGGY